MSLLHSPCHIHHAGTAGGEVYLLNTQRLMDFRKGDTAASTGDVAKDQARAHAGVQSKFSSVVKCANHIQFRNMI